MKYAEVAVDAPVGPGKTFSYSVPEHFSVGPGQLVWVPLARRITQGVVVELPDAPQVEYTRDILQPIEPSPLVSSTGLELAQWMSRYYLCSLFDAIGLFLPPGFKAQVRSQIIPAPVSDSDLEPLASQAREAFETLTSKGWLGEGEFTQLLGRNGARELRRLVEKGLVYRQVDVPRPRVFRYECYLLPATNKDVEDSPESPGNLPSRQAQLLQAVRSQGEAYPATLANKEFGQGVVNALVEKGLLGLEWVRVETQPAYTNQEPKSSSLALVLTPMQSETLNQITEALDDPSRQPHSFLLHGVTGSGKTEVYLRAMKWVVERGQQAILLVPEIALTPQTVERVSARFPGRVAVLHSHLKPRQRFDQWWQIRDGNYDVVIGPRSALFAPVPSLGLIVIDEEHEWTYKQEEAQPLYHARRAALELARLTGAVVLMGSATPDVETYYHARRGRHSLLELPHRIRGANGNGGGPGLAQTEICDMRQELREGNRSIFSRQLAQTLTDCVRQGQQAILFLNRRGNAPIVQCRDCGYVVACRSCSVALTYHSTDARMVCHRCNRRSRVPRRCRQCSSNKIRQLGIGTQRVVDEVAALLPGVRVERWDADASRAGASHEEIMRRLASGETQVLVGTQMVAKGLDVPNVTLVGVMLADIGLHLPDFRAGERTFGLLCQVAGRAGRGPAPGRVIIQTYNPDHYAIVAAAHQDYSTLYQREIKARYQQGNPPFNRLAHLVYQDVNATACQRQASVMARMFRQKAYAQGLTDVEVIGPAPGIPQRVRGHHRWHVILRGRNLHRFLEGVKFPAECIADVDPVHVL
jgi:primosomal protein N' (replication factor Y) (superfamily II helicase)